MMIQGKVWGYTCPLFFKNNVELHFIKVKKGGYCSKHLHKYKYNQFIVFEGQLKVTIWKQYGIEILQDVTFVGKDQICIVPPGEFHKFEALEDTTALEVYWVDLNQNDIVREDQGGLFPNETSNVDGGALPSRGDRKAILIDEVAVEESQRKQLYGKKYFGNEPSER